MFDKHPKFDYPVIDLDGHIWDSPLIFSEYLEPKYRERAHELLSHRGPGLGNVVQGKKVGAAYGYHMFSDHKESMRQWREQPDYRFPGEDDGHVRLGCMDLEGIDAMIVRNTVTAGVFSLPPEHNDLVEAVCRAYNNWINDFCAADRTRLYPEALLPCGNMPAALKEMERTAKMGFKSTVVPGSTHSLPLSDPHWDPLFSCMEEMGWPLFIHAAFDPNTPTAARWLQDPQLLGSSSGGAFFSTFLNLNFYIDNIVTLAEITLGGMLDKHPDLPVVFIESGNFGFGELIYRLDKHFDAPWLGTPQTDTWAAGLKLGAKTPPSEQFARQVHVMFEGGDRSMSKDHVEKYCKNYVWCSDIPHFDGDGPWEGAGALRTLRVRPEVEKAIMGGNGAKLLHIPYEKKVGASPQAIVPAVAA